MTDGPIKRMVLDLLRQAHGDELTFVAALTPAQRDAQGTHDHWSAKDRAAQIAAWKERQSGKLAAAVRGETPPRWTDMAVVDPLNAATYAEYADRPWADVLRFEECALAELVGQVERLAEDDLANPHKYPAVGEALWPETLGNGIWFPFTMLTDIARERGDPAQLAQLAQRRLHAHKRMLSALVEAGESPRALAGPQYDLACLYAQAGEPTQALQSLAVALLARPELAGHARHDTDLVSLHGGPEFDELTAAGRESPLATAASAREATGVRLLMVDVREPDEYAAGHIEGAVNIPLGQLEDRVAEIPTGQSVVTYCNMRHRGTSRSEQASLFLRLRGRVAAALDGGYPGWKEAGFPVAESK